MSDTTCACGCGEMFDTGNPSRLYVDDQHRHKFHFRARDLGIRLLRGQVKQSEFARLFGSTPDPENRDVSGEERRADALRQVNNEKNEQLRVDLVSAAAEMMWRESAKTLTASEIWEQYEADGNEVPLGCDPRVIGVVLCALRREGLIRNAGYHRTSKRACANARPETVWEIL